VVAEEAPRFMILGTVKAEDEPTMTTMTRRAMAAERTMVNQWTRVVTEQVFEDARKTIDWTRLFCG